MVQMQTRSQEQQWRIRRTTQTVIPRFQSHYTMTDDACLALFCVSLRSGLLVRNSPWLRLGLGEQTLASKTSQSDKARAKSQQG